MGIAILIILGGALTVWFFVQFVARWQTAIERDAGQQFLNAEHISRRIQENWNENVSKSAVNASRTRAVSPAAKIDRGDRREDSPPIQTHSTFDHVTAFDSGSHGSTHSSDASCHDTGNDSGSGGDCNGGGHERMAGSVEKGVSIGSAEAKRESDKAVLMAIDDIGEVWLPKSQIHDDSEVWKVGQKGDLIVTTWYAEQKGWS